MNRIISITVFLIATSALAHEHERVGHHACAPVWKACSAAGLEGKEAKKACVDKIKSGATVENVKVTDDDLKACQAAAK